MQLVWKVRKMRMACGKGEWNLTTLPMQKLNPLLKDRVALKVRLKDFQQGWHSFYRLLFSIFFFAVNCFESLSLIPTFSLRSFKLEVAEPITFVSKVDWAISGGCAFENWSP
jgi:hypothetical protein